MLEQTNRGQICFDPLKYSSRTEALKARREYAKTLKQQGYRTLLWTLRNQQVGYSGLGTVRDLSTRNVYMLDYYKPF